MTTAPTTTFRARLLQRPPSARQRELVGFIVTRLRDSLELDPSEEFHARSRFTDLGVDSKRAVEFKELLEEELECRLRTTLMFDYPTPEALAAHILASVFAAAPAVPAPAPAPADADPGEKLRAKLAKYGG